MSDDRKSDNAENRKSIFNAYSPSAIKEFIKKTPCARNSFLYGIGGGLTAATSTFLYTKHIRRSCDLAVVSFALISLCSWEWCRYNHRKEKEEIKKTVDLLNRYSNSKENDQTDPKIA